MAIEKDAKKLGKYAAIGGIATAVGVGIYYLIKKVGEPEPPPDGELPGWIRIDDIAVTAIMGSAPPAGWFAIEDLPVVAILGAAPPTGWFTIGDIPITAKVSEVPVDVTLSVELKNYDQVWDGLGYYWSCYALDPETWEWVGDGSWHRVTTKINFTNIPIGQSKLSVILKRQYTPITSEEFRSNFFTIRVWPDNCWYRYNLVTNSVPIYCV